MNAKRVLFWLAAAGLAALGWYSVVPVWTQGLGGIALDAQGQPGLWIAAAKIAILLGGWILWSDLKTGGESPRSGVTAASFGFGAFVFSGMLFLCATGQPLRLGYVLSDGRFRDYTFVATCSYFLCLISLAWRVRRASLPGKLRRMVEGIVYLALLTSLMGQDMVYAVVAPCLGNVIHVRTRTPKHRNLVRRLSGGALLVFAALAYWLGNAALTPLLLGAGLVLVSLVKNLAWPGFLADTAVCVGIMAALYLRGASTILPCGLEWLVLAFAVGCGLLAGWLVRPSKFGATTPSEKEIFDDFATDA